MFDRKGRGPSNLNKFREQRLSVHIYATEQGDAGLSGTNARESVFGKTLWCGGRKLGCLESHPHRNGGERKLLLPPGERPYPGRLEDGLRFLLEVLLRDGLYLRPPLHQQASSQPNVRATTVAEGCLLGKSRAPVTGTALVEKSVTRTQSVAWYRRGTASDGHIIHAIRGPCGSPRPMLALSRTRMTTPSAPTEPEDARRTATSDTVRIRL